MLWFASQAGLNFTPLGFETSFRDDKDYDAKVLNFTPLGFETLHRLSFLLFLAR